MKLILILIFGFICFSNEEKYDLLGIISKTKSQTTKSNNYYVYLEISEFSDESELIIATTVYDGYFTESKIYYGEGDTLPSYIYLNQTKSSYMSSSSGSGYNYDWTYHSKIYNHYSYYYKISKPTHKYLYLSINDFRGSYAKIEISSGFPVWAIVLLVVLGVIIVSVIIIVIIKYIKRKRANYIPPSSTNNYYSPQVNTYTNNPINYQSPNSPVYPLTAQNYY